METECNIFDEDTAKLQVDFMDGDKHIVEDVKYDSRRYT